MKKTYSIKIRARFSKNIKEKLTKVIYLDDIVGFVKKIDSIDGDYLTLILSIYNDNDIHEDMLFKTEGNDLIVRRKCGMYYNVFIPWAFKNNKTDLLDPQDIEWYNNEYLKDGSKGH